MSNGLRTTVAGSWWPLAKVEDDLASYHRGELSAERGEAVLREAASIAIDEQRGLGLAEWTGGEYFAFEFLDHLHSRLTGLRLISPTREVVFDYDDLAVAEIDGEITAPNGLGYADAYERERDLPGGVGMATVAGPVEVAASVARQRAGVKDQMPNLIAIVNAEVRRLADLGCPHIQLDVPTVHWSISADPANVDAAAEMLSQCFEGVSGVRRGIHICSGNLGGRPVGGNLSCESWVALLERLDGVVDVAHLALHYYNRYLERDLFKAVPDSIEIAAGIVDEGCYYVETTQKIRERAADWARVIGEERLWISLSCGMGRHTHREIPVLREKIENLVEAAASF